MQRQKLFISGVVGLSLITGLLPKDNSQGIVKADFGISLGIGIISSVAGKIIYDGFFRDMVNNEAAKHTTDIRDRQCAAAFPNYNPGTGIYWDKWGRKHVCPYLLNNERPSQLGAPRK